MAQGGKKSKRKTNNAILIQSVFKMYRARKSFKEIVNKFKERSKVFGEIFETEKEYVSNLAIVNAVYLKPLELYVPTQQELALLGNLISLRSKLDVISKVQKKFFDELAILSNQWGPHKTVGAVFLENMQDFEIYPTYLNYYQTVIPLLASIKGTPLAIDLEQKSKNKVCKNKGIKDFLIMPAQRIPRYSLLIKDLMKCTPRDHPDYQNLEVAFNRMNILAGKVDSTLNNSKAVDKMINYSMELKFKLKNFCLAEPHRKFLAEAEARVVISEYGNIVTLENCLLIVFNDIALFCSATLDKTHKRRVDRIQPLEGIHFCLSNENETSCVSFLYNPTCTPGFITIYTNPKDANHVYEVLLRKETNHSLHSINVIPVLAKTEFSRSSVDLKLRMSTMEKPKERSNSETATDIKYRSPATKRLSKKTATSELTPFSPKPRAVPDLDMIDTSKLPSGAQTARSPSKKLRQTLKN